MKRLALILALVFVVAVALPALAVKPDPSGKPVKPQGKLAFNLNILGKADQCPGDDLKGLCSRFSF